MSDEPKNTGGDTFTVSGTVVGSAIGRGASVTAEQIIAHVTQAAQTSPGDLTAAVTKALAELKQATLAEPDRADAAGTVGKIQDEVKKTDPDPARPGRVTRWLDSLAAVCKPAADALRAAGAVVAAVTG
ncbi:hypothetical protein GobsT_09470 [Gemmata obscuriglobus]|uniref:Uncharacterized protein n=1 Tax=Gemmata obscuriglobus TaxID=114 RepID=A0A2Z3H196_9BACT|nr:hypothetical protein [Gemmata obscuriglobus]AWM40539.1 hypothetical protein C1280_28525 [Gemmata obscuriglobus]QEG26208.1 hypothetical protein GobsT_09470 [Gemmata obscuriglobus]VTS00912.1 unnamed protein product [Gemmata obscuriglobus UQM 2246]